VSGERDARELCSVANRILALSGLAAGVTASLGHASLRLPDNPERFLVKGRGYKVDALAMIRPEDLVLCDLDGQKLGGPDGVTQCFEVKMHSCLLRERPDINAVVHAHPRYVVAMSVVGDPLRPCAQEGAQLVRRPLPVYPHMRTVVTEEHGMDVVRTMGSARALILLGHGATTVGRSVQEAITAMIQLEEQARMNWVVRAAGGNTQALADDLVQEMEDQVDITQLPHFQGLFPGDRRPQVTGLWDYYALQARDSTVPT
jgi:ribulose-5-phosphate 4-epimerase/fuculose-1-phosphate aldolase